MAGVKLTLCKVRHDKDCLCLQRLAQHLHDEAHEALLAKLPTLKQ